MIPLSLRSLLAASFVRFAVTGALAFVVDAGAFTLFHALGVAAIPARILSFPVAYTVNWYLNRVWSFAAGRGHPAARQYAVYGAIQIVGAGINLIVFALLLRTGPIFRDFPVLAIAAGAVVALVFNYLVGRRFAFASPRNDPGGP